MVDLAGKDIISAAELSPDEILHITETARRLEKVASGEEKSDLLAGRVLASLFYEPSTRTRLSFESSMLRLGGQAISVAEIHTSSAAKGESLADTVRTVEAYSDVIALRHPKEGAAQLAADSVRIPLINAGDGAGHHPTQALLDLYTIQKERGNIEGLNIVLLGDLKHGRTVHSLVHVISNFGVSLKFVTPPALAMPLETTWILKMRGVPVEETSDLETAIRDADVLYVTRLQEERFADRAEYERLKGSYRVDLSLLERAKPGVTIMHPLPRTDEIAPEVDNYEGAAYFRQVANGLPIRMALLALVLGEA